MRPALKGGVVVCIAALGCAPDGVAKSDAENPAPQEGLPSVVTPPNPVHRPNTVAELRAVLEDCPTSSELVPVCPHLVYVWSPQMPLSELAIPEIELAASAMGVPLSILPAAAAVGVTAATSATDPSTASTRDLRRSLVEAGATVHYPSIVLVKGTDPWGPAVVGHRKAQGYRALLEPRIAALRAGADPVVPESTGQPVATAEDLEPLKVVWRQTIDPPPGFFFRRAPGTRFISYDQRRKVHLHQLETGEKLLGPGFIDFVPTPDGALFVTPSHSDGLEFYSASTVFHEARMGRGEHVEPVFRDPELDDQYPSVGIVENEPGVSTTYRVLVSWFEGLAVREYRVEWGEAGGAEVIPVTPRIDACPGMALSTPIMSKDGQEIAARDELTGTTKLFRYHADGSCSEVLDFGTPTSKVGFSHDGRLIAFSRRDGPNGISTVWVHDRETGLSIQVPESASRGLTIPEFVGPDSLLFLVGILAQREPSEFRIVCCVR